MTGEHDILQQRLDDGPLICAEGFLFELERRGYLAAGEFVPEVALAHPEALEALHREFQRAGSDIVQAFTYNGHREKRRLIDKEALLEPLNRSALRMARRVADTAAGRPDLVAGNIANTNRWDPARPRDSEQTVRPMFAEMVAWAVEEGADIVIGETFHCAAEALTALDVIRASGLPAVITLAPVAGPALSDGVDYLDCCRELERRGASVVGLNCFRGPHTMLPLLADVRAAVSCPVAGLPVPYRTTEAEPTFLNLADDDTCRCPAPHGRTLPTALDPLLVNRYEIADFARQARELGVDYLGVCCGAAPIHIRAIAEQLGRQPPVSRYSERMSHHFLYGDPQHVPEHLRALGERG